MPIIFSTLTADNRYGPFVQGGADLPRRPQSVLINGGANLINRRTFVTPRGVATTITDKELAICDADPIFQLHKKNGFIVIDAAKDERDAEKVAASMEGRDSGSPLVDADFKKGEAPITNGEKVDVPVETPRRRR